MNETTVLLTRHTLDVDACCRMAEASILAADARVELDDGEVIDMAPVGTDHGGHAEKAVRRSGAPIALALDPGVAVDLRAAFGP